MKSPIRLESSAELSTIVQVGENTITLGETQEFNRENESLGLPAHAVVYSTPSMINLMEHAARKALLPFLEAGEKSVGVDVQVKHLSATPPGQRVTATATITAVEKNLVTFNVEAQDSQETIGSGTHRRAVVKTSKLANRVSDKQSRQDQPSQHPVSVSQHPLDFSVLKHFQVERARKTLIVQLNRPSKKNAINRSMTLELQSLLGWLEHSSEIQVVIFHGAGQVFSAGDDISELDPRNPEMMSDLSLLRGSTYRRLANLKQVTIAAVDGFALGGGFVFVAACDFRVASHSAKFGLPETTMGWPPNYGIEIIHSLLGRTQAIQLSVLGEAIGARRAHELGWVYRVVAADQLLPTAHQIANQVVRSSAQAIGSVKKLMQLESSNPNSMDKDEAATAEFLNCLKSQFAQDSIDTF